MQGGERREGRALEMLKTESRKKKKKVQLETTKTPSIFLSPLFFSFLYEISPALVNQETTVGGKAIEGAKGARLQIVIFLLIFVFSHF